LGVIFLSKNGYFLLDKKTGKVYIKNFYPSEYTTGEDYFYIKATKINLEKIQKYIKDEEIDKSCYLFELQKGLKRSNLSPATRKTYFSVNINFLKVINKRPEKVKKEDVERFISILKRRGKSANTLSVAYSALKFFYHSILGNVDFKKIDRPESTIPISGPLSRREISKIIKNTQNEKHRLLIEVAYGCGLRLNETIKLKKEDILFEQKIFFIKKNGKTRKVPIPQSLISRLNDYTKRLHSDYLFFSEKNLQKHISPRAAEQIFKKSLKKAGIKRNLSFKSLRDSFVTHLIDKNVNPELIRKIIGIKKNQFLNKYGFYIDFINYIPDLLIFED